MKTFEEIYQLREELHKIIQYIICSIPNNVSVNYYKICRSNNNKGETFSNDSIQEKDAIKAPTERIKNYIAPTSYSFKNKSHVNIDLTKLAKIGYKKKTEVNEYPYEYYDNFKDAYRDLRKIEKAIEKAKNDGAQEYTKHPVFYIDSQIVIPNEVKNGVLNGKLTGGYAISAYGDVYDLDSFRDHNEFFLEEVVKQEYSDFNFDYYKELGKSDFGKADDYLFNFCYKKDWIRIRLYNNDMFIDIFKLDKHSEDILYKFCNDWLEGIENKRRLKYEMGDNDSNMEKPQKDKKVYLAENYYDPPKVITTSIKKISDFELYKMLNESIKTFEEIY